MTFNSWERTKSNIRYHFGLGERWKVNTKKRFIWGALGTLSFGTKEKKEKEKKGCKGKTKSKPDQTLGEILRAKNADEIIDIEKVSYFILCFRCFWFAFMLRVAIIQFNLDSIRKKVVPARHAFELFLSRLSRAFFLRLLHRETCFSSFHRRW